MNYEAKTNVEKYKLQQEEYAKNAKKEEAILKECVDEITKKDYGKIFLQFIKKISLWDEQDGNIDKDILAYKKGRRDIWLIIRNYLPKEILAEIEIYKKYRIEER